MITQTEKSLSSVFGIPIQEEENQKHSSIVESHHNNEIEVKSEDDKIKIIEQESSEIRNDAQEDFSMARDNLKRLLEDGEDLLDSAIRIAQSTEDPKAVAAANNVLQGLAKINTSLMDIAQKRQEIVNNSRIKNLISRELNTKPGSIGASEGNTTNVQNITNNVQFVGTSNELLELIKQVKLEGNS